MPPASPMATPTPKSVKLYHIFAVVCNPTRIFVKREFLFFSPSPLRGKVEKSISPRKIRGKTQICPSAKRLKLPFHKMSSPSSALTASDRSRALARPRGRFLPLFTARRSYAKSPPVSTPIRPSNHPTFLHIPAPLLSFRSSSTDEIRRSPPTHPLWVTKIWNRGRSALRCRHLHSFRSHQKLVALLLTFL